MKKHLDTSVSSLDQDDIPFDDRYIRNFSRQMLKGRLFIGSFQEKRYVEPLNSYRDVVSLSTNEKDLIKDLLVVKNRIADYYPKDYWVGITTPDMVGAPATHCVWTELPQDQVFGRYWFKIKTVKFKGNEFFLQLQVVRSACNNNGSQIANEISADNNDTFDYRLDLIYIKQWLAINLQYIMNNIATVHNTKQIIIFIGVMLVAIVTGCFQLLQFLCDFLLKFMREASYFMHSASPILIACINVLGKSIYGLYMLIAYMWRDRRSSTPARYFISNNPGLSYYPGHTVNNYQRALPSSRNSQGVVITELN